VSVWNFLVTWIITNLFIKCILLLFSNFHLLCCYSSCVSCLNGPIFIAVQQSYKGYWEGTRGDHWRDLGICETGRGQQVAQHHGSYMMIMTLLLMLMITIVQKVCVVSTVQINNLLAVDLVKIYCFEHFTLHGYGYQNTNF
jgi:hypothetical protein